MMRICREAVKWKKWSETAWTETIPKQVNEEWVTLLGQRPIYDLQLYAKVIKFLNPLIYIPQIKHRPRPAPSRN